ncbi:VOC family protein [Phaeobacter sp. 22II1-1F12B]|uniref:VOC family protein n=1 Tax=Phaeobacter sp. 22II1-1F12B TaxID=1317111 RepID=UPI000B52714E|nr:VOC family protein [Phaeobacter sp. 22II1-1F12B]OWU82202.1 glyoxalase [Phaeobacter sp. 22II1-1F12B]
MDYDTVSPEDFGRSLSGLGINLLVRDVRRQCAFLTGLFGMTAHQASDDFAILRYGEQVFQIHSDGTYHANPLLGLLPETPPRGAGIEIRLYDSDPDAAVDKAEAADATILQAPTDKPHGLREAYILCENGYAWVPSRVL